MHRPLLPAFLLMMAMPITVYAETEGEVYEEVDKIFAEATDEVGENLAKFVEANQKPLGTARDELSELIARLNKEGRSQLATSVQKRVNSLEETVQKRASAKVPIVEPASKPLLERMAGKWDRTTYHEYVRLSQDGSAVCVRKNDDGVSGEASIRVTAPDVAEIRWSNGFRWELRPAGEDAIAVFEWGPGGDRIGQGFALERIK